ncbi:GNAT family N-acetyltransferase [Pseudonocardia spirodelae]|uniref:GNAT family protein n=1 Tax=Pseudonocardia spirodelae TaxID=3133431 RepID=A0ABU8T4B0_9PSEU
MDVLPAPIDPVPDPWPMAGLVLRTPRLELRIEDDASLRELVTAVHVSGIHPASEMPFRMPWTEADPRYLGRGMLQYAWSNRVRASPEWWTLAFVVRAGGRVIGLQDVVGDRFGVRREVATGSYLVRHAQGRGHGTEMRAAVLAFAFDHLGAHSARSEYTAGNGASAAVSARLGYRPDGTTTLVQRGARVTEQRLLLERDGFVRPDWMTAVEGYTPGLAEFLGTDRPRAD